VLSYQFIFPYYLQAFTMPSSLQHIFDIRRFAIKEESLRCWRNCTNDIMKVAYCPLKSTAVSSKKFKRQFSFAAHTLIALFVID